MKRHFRLPGLIALCCLAAACNSEVRQAEDAVRRAMKDPDATQFREVSACPDDPALIRGEYNSKNGYGAYVGFQPFYHAADTGVVLLSDDQFSTMTSRCYGTDAAGGIDIDSPVDETHSAPAPLPLAADYEAPPEPAGTPRCLGDYCPCDTADPDYGGADETLCQSMKHGEDVDDTMLSAGATMRDVRRQIRTFDGGGS
ncbi:hypothetical protein [Erythrobacter sp. SG61-1L]|uniref:hypothetical protein n=1 Tax=Erythrobacter sp. SG61-1L TaxID=1603897 RepID=UPI0006C9069E|nr:hypothetical protein [Erythrobacter sp. SG61-1L]